MRPLALLRSLALTVALLCACEGADDGLTVEQLTRVVAEQRPSLKTCYDAALEQTPYKHEVRMNAVIHIEPSGKVLEVELDEGGLAGMAACVREAILAWTFPAAESETHTSLPIIFKPELTPAPAARGGN
jgi:hypothetical protein